MSLMLNEALSAPSVLRTQWHQNQARVAALAKALLAAPPRSILTVARGSSDHAAAFFGYLAMKHLGCPVASLPPSLSTERAAPWRVTDQLAIAFSQSGESPDLITTQRALALGGARTLALINAENTPLAAASDQTLPLHAGREESVAATKSYLATLAAGAHLVGAWAENAALLDALEALPARLEEAAALNWQPAIDTLKQADRLLVIGRGSGLAVAQEAALKFKETCGIQAEAFSGAEVRHGPMALIEPGYPVMIFAPQGPEQTGLLALADDLESMGARVMLAADDHGGTSHLPVADAGHEDLQPLSIIQSFYSMAAALAEARGSNPDQPRHLRKVTRTR
ncbi:SIS domain-containing protein [Larsenimonas rhizosphaerae]|uniref:SIS domain-containing protein n=1 Tax=Larsenimonas rhizosphaerae TaxID=2944682 RepID=UPI002033A195|nr:SIS domain-containing protein [Larsenimonas rhizosphaerae]MCM2132194.1 SIS domain-containing protein [Larsenimonas rhizosphaerae]